MRRMSSLSYVLLVLLAIGACVPGSPTPALTAADTDLQSTQAQATAAPAAADIDVQSTQAQAMPTAPVEPAPSATVAAVQVTDTPTAPERWITLSEPVLGAAITSPVHVHGEVAITPFESTLRGRVYDAHGQVLGEAPIMLPSEMGQPGVFDGFLSFSATSGGAGEVEIAELSAKDGSIVVRASVAVEIRVESPPGMVEIPAKGDRIVLPLRILARVGQPGELVQATLRWQDGTELSQSFNTLTGEDGKGLLIDSLNWPGESQPPQPPTQPAALELRNAAGDLLARQELVVVSADDPDTQSITLYFLLGADLQPVTRRIPKTVAIGTAALEELLWGPPAPNLAGFGTELPSPKQVLSYPGRGPDWGPRVTLLGLTISDGIAIADFSKEMEAYGGGSVRVSLIRHQIESTLKQFPSVSHVIIAVEGETEQVLQP
jgi:hypothetical protein